ncbi:hypothetical protein [Streptomyces avermitilis]|uniref:hypothetical protein n=1 Tax=Streptomyces avermitilis TaxID=33903 RepID=UPI00382A7A22
MIHGGPEDGLGRQGGAVGSMSPMCPPMIHVADVAADGDARTVSVLVPLTDAPFT